MKHPVVTFSNWISSSAMKVSGGSRRVPVNVTVVVCDARTKGVDIVLKRGTPCVLQKQ